MARLLSIPLVLLGDLGLRPGIIFSEVNDSVGLGWHWHTLGWRVNYRWVPRGKVEGGIYHPLLGSAS